MRFFKQTKWFEVYFEVREERILDRLHDHRCEDGNHEFWFGRLYLTFYRYQRKPIMNDPGEAVAL